MSFFHKFQLTSQVPNRCSASKCRYSNSPQAAEVTDDCDARISGSYCCDDPHLVPHTADDEVIRLHQESGRQETEPECMAQSKVRSEEVKCAKLLRYQREQGKQQAATATYELKPLKVNASGRQLEHGIGQRRPCGADEATQHSTSYHPRSRTIPQSYLSRDSHDYLIRLSAAATKQRKDLHRDCPIPVPSMSHPRACLTHPTFRT